MGMEKGDREDFFKAFVPDRLNQFGLTKITQRFDVFINLHSWAPLSLDPIPRKKFGESFEDFLSKSTTSRKQVAHCMRFSMEEYDVLTVWHCSILH
jgi:hypothetical protein